MRARQHRAPAQSLPCPALAQGAAAAAEAPHRAPPAAALRAPPRTAATAAARRASPPTPTRPPPARRRRAGAGGKQSSKDASGKYARSAGSRLRRYNEAALERDIHELLAAWQQQLAVRGGGGAAQPLLELLPGCRGAAAQLPPLPGPAPTRQPAARLPAPLAPGRAPAQAADLIFVHAPGSNARVLFPDAGEQGGPPPLAAADPRVRRIPFVLRRPTYSETKRAVRTLTTLYQPDLAALQQQQQQAAASASSSQRGEAAGGSSKGAAEGKQQAAPVPPAAQEQQQQAAKAKAEDPPLHKAAKAGDEERVSRLLEAGHDPTQQDAQGRVPYQLAASKGARDAFRRFAAQQPERWDYRAAQLPSALTEEMEAAQEAKKVCAGAGAAGAAGGGAAGGLWRDLRAGACMHRRWRLPLAPPAAAPRARARPARAAGREEGAAARRGQGAQAGVRRKEGGLGRDARDGAGGRDSARGGRGGGAGGQVGLGRGCTGTGVCCAGPRGPARGPPGGRAGA